MKHDQNIMLAPQRDVVDDDPSLEDLHAIGTVARVKQVLHPQGENLRILVTGICRARIQELTQTEPFRLFPKRRSWIPPRHMRCGGRPTTSMDFTVSFWSILLRRFS